MSNLMTPKPLVAMATSSLTSTQRHDGKSSSWYEAKADAWGKTLNAKANEIETAADQMTEGADDPSHITKMTSLAQQMGFMSNSAQTSLQSVGTALETLARKG